MKTFALAASLLGMLALAVWGAVYAWRAVGDIEMSLVGILAMAGGVLLSLALGIGLMFLVFKSERDGAGPE
jgi:hypothetical protein